MSETIEYDFEKLITKFVKDDKENSTPVKIKIVVPLIQRDYAQGRDDKHSNDVRERFLDDILNALKDNKKLELDFIYGKLEKISDSVYKFIPLDGQQRLTTLYLLHWYLGALPSVAKDCLSYETRASAREFCAYLAKNSLDDIKKLGDDKLSTLIKSDLNFMSVWQDDPSVKAMLNMLDSIEKKGFKGVKATNLELIKFKFLNLDKFKLTDELYVKMNARGKPLNEFELIKASFEKLLLEKNYSELYKDFVKKIETEWVDNLWKWGDNINKQIKLIDSAFVRLFKFIAGMNYLVKNGELVQFELAKIDEFYPDEDSIKILFAVLEKIKEIAAKFNECLIFYDRKQSNLASLKDHNKIAVFKASRDNDESELSSMLEFIEKGDKVNLKQSGFLFIAFLAFKLKKQDSLSHFWRIYRNLIGYTRQRYSADVVRVDNFSSKELCLILRALKDSEFNDEREFLNKLPLASKDKELAKLEFCFESKKYIDILDNHPQIKGQSDLIITPNLKPEEIRQRVDAVYDIFNGEIPEYIIAAAMLSVDDYSFEVGYGKHGFGWNGNYECWEQILTVYESEQDSFVADFLNSFLKAKQHCGNARETLEKMSSEFIESVDENEIPDWRYYFCKYPKEFLGNLAEVRMSYKGEEREFNIENKRFNNVFMWRDDGKDDTSNNDELVYNIEKMSGSTVSSPMMNPYLYAALKDAKGVKFKRYYKDSSYHYSYASIEGKINEIVCRNKGWKIKFNSSFKPDSEILKDFGVVECSENNEYLLLAHTADEDTIKNLQEFLENLLKAK